MNSNTRSFERPLEKLSTQGESKSGSTRPRLSTVVSSPYPSSAKITPLRYKTNEAKYSQQSLKPMGTPKQSVSRNSKAPPSTSSPLRDQVSYIFSSDEEIGMSNSVGRGTLTIEVRHTLSSSEEYLDNQCDAPFDEEKASFLDLTKIDAEKGFRTIYQSTLLPDSISAPFKLIRVEYGSPFFSLPLLARLLAHDGRLEIEASFNEAKVINQLREELSDCRLQMISIRQQNTELLSGPRSPNLIVCQPT